MFKLESPRFSKREFSRSVSQAIGIALRGVSHLSVFEGDDEAQSPLAPSSSAHDDTYRRPRSTRSRKPRDMSSSHPLPPPPDASPKRATVRRRARGRGDKDDCIVVGSRFGEVEVRGKAVDYLKEFHPRTFHVPDHIPIGEMVEVWGKRWMVRQSRIHPDMGLGLFALQDIIVSSEDPSPELFPFCGPYYLWGKWSVITKAAPSFAKYSLSADAYPRSDGSTVPRGELRMIDGDPVRSCNIAGYINSSKIPRRLKDEMPTLVPNVEWIFCDGAPKRPDKLGTPATARRGAPATSTPMPFHILTVALKTIRAGEELLCKYDW